MLNYTALKDPNKRENEDSIKMKNILTFYRKKTLKRIFLKM